MTNRKHYTMSFAGACTHTPLFADRTAKRYLGGDGSLNFDVEFKVFSSRAAMAKTIRMQQRRAPHARDWRPCVVLSDGEGF